MIPVDPELPNPVCPGDFWGSLSCGEDEVESQPDETDYIIATDGLLARKSGEWAKRKHHYLNNYCGITTKGIRNKGLRLIYLDVMAGPGLCKIKESGEEFPGSPLVALSHEFAEYWFIESAPNLADALQGRLKGHAKADRIKVLREDWCDLANSGRLRFGDRDLVVAFVDPTGISQVPMTAMMSLAANSRIDILMTIQHGLGVVWNAPQFFRCQNETALDRFLDWDGWRSEWRGKGPTEIGRLAIDHFGKRLETKGFISTRHISVPEARPLYRFTLFSRHKRGEDFWQKILRLDEKGQRDFPGF